MKTEEFDYHNVTDGGVDCKFWNLGHGVGLKLYDDADVGIMAWVVQKDLAEIELTPAVLSEPQGFYYRNLRNELEMRTGYLTEIVTVATECNKGWQKHHREVDDLLREEGNELFGALQEELVTESGLDFHSNNWGLNKKHRPVMIDTGRHFYKKVEQYDEIKAEVFKLCKSRE